MALDYKKKILLTSVNKDTGIIGYNFIYEPTDSISNEIESIKESLNIVNRIPGSGDKMYFLNGVTIPRFKIKQFHADKGTKVVKYIESSNLVIIGKTTISEYFDTQYLYSYDKDEIIQYLNNWIESNKKQEDKDLELEEEWAIDLIEQINSCGEDLLKKNEYHSCKYLEEHDLYSFSNGNRQVISSDNYDKLQKIINMKCEFIDESIILKELNTTLTMDSEMYTSIQRLLESSDNENVRLAMEMMANCDYDSSAMYLLLLLKNHENKIYNTSAKHHVNFKAMLNYFDYKPNSNFNFTIDGLITKLKDRNILIKSQMDILIPLILEEYDKKPRSEHYRVSMVTFVDDEGEDIVVEEELPEIEELNVESLLIHEITPPEEIPDIVEEVIVPELDDIIFDELTEVIGYCNRLGFSTPRDILIGVRSFEKPSEDLLEVIKFLDSDISSEYVTILINAYLNM